MNWYIEVLRKYAVFAGRARRKEYWMFCLINALVIVGLIMVDMKLMNATTAGLGLATIIYCVLVFLPSLAVNVRRLHDTGRSGWWILLYVVPVLGPIVLFVFSVLDSTPGENRFGPNPKAVAA